jgi:toxin ParE1/3/4
MAFNVRFTLEARADLREIHAQILEKDSRKNADYVAQGIVRAAFDLREYPNRGSYPPELLRKGSRSFRQIFFKPYRILYRIRGNTVFIGVIADGRRNLQSLLMRRLQQNQG